MKIVSTASTYAALIPDLQQAAREVGYALCVHGSLARDLDLVAVPWVEEAASAEQLILALLSASGGALRDGGDGAGNPTRGHVATTMAHGRRAWTIHLGHGSLYIDVSVMPRKSEASP